MSEWGGEWDAVNILSLNHWGFDKKVIILKLT